MHCRSSHSHLQFWLFFLLSIFADKFESAQPQPQSQDFDKYKKIGVGAESQNERKDSFSELKKYVVISCDSTREYAFYLPLSAEVWRSVGYEPIVLLIGTDWRTGSLPWTVTTINRLINLSVETHIIDLPPRTTHSTAAQLARLFAAAELGLAQKQADEDHIYVLVVDVDAWPLDPAHYTTHRDWSRRVHLYNAFCCGAKPVDWRGFRYTRPVVTSSVELTSLDGFFPENGVDPDRSPDWYRVYPIGTGVGATVSAWREIMGQPRSADAAADGGPGRRIADWVLRAMQAELARASMGQLGRGNRGALEGSRSYRCV